MTPASNGVFISIIVWLDPELAKKEVENIRDGLIKIDPKNRDYYMNNSMHFLNNLGSLDREIRTDLLSCKKKDFISFHNAFSYFAKRYGLINTVFPVHRKPR